METESAAPQAYLTAEFFSVQNDYDLCGLTAWGILHWSLCLWLESHYSENWWFLHQKVWLTII